MSAYEQQIITGTSNSSVLSKKVTLINLISDISNVDFLVSEWVHNENISTNLYIESFSDFIFEGQSFKVYIWGKKKSPSEYKLRMVFGFNDLTDNTQAESKDMTYESFNTFTEDIIKSIKSGEYNVIAVKCSGVKDGQVKCLIDYYS